MKCIICKDKIKEGGYTYHNVGIAGVDLCTFCNWSLAGEMLKQLCIEKMCEGVEFRNKEGLKKLKSKGESLGK